MNNTKYYYSPKQGRLPVFISDILNICDPVLAFDRIMEEIEIDKYLKPEPFSRLGRPGYNIMCAKSMRKTLLRDEVIGKAGSSGIMKNSRGI